jgi:Bacterial PH domain
MINEARINFVHALSRALEVQPFRSRLLAPLTGTKLPKPVVRYINPTAYESPKTKTRRLKRELLDAGVTVYGLLKAESRYLPKIMHDNEHIEAVIYGQHHSSSAMMIATDERIVYLDKKPMVEMFDEVSYEVISGIEFDIHTFFATVVLHTPVRNYDFKFVNLRCAEKFARHIEKHRLEREPKSTQPDEELLGYRPEWPAINDRGLNDMAGYYLLPTDDDEKRKIQQMMPSKN